MGPATRRLRLPDNIADLIRTMHPHLKMKVRAAFKTMLAEPHSGKALKEELSGIRSFRVARFRIIYRIAKDGMIEVIAVGPRKTIYEETLRLLLKEKV